MWGQPSGESHMNPEVSQGQGLQCLAMQGDVGKVTFWVAAIQDWRQLSVPLFQAKFSTPRPSVSSAKDFCGVLSSRAIGTPTDGAGGKPQSPGIQWLHLASASCCFSEGWRCVGDHPRRLGAWWVGSLLYPALLHLIYFCFFSLIVLDNGC